MARIDALPSIEIIRGLKGILDFYLWRGLPCVRAWPQYRPAKQTPASLAAALTFGAIVKAYSRMGEIALQAYRDDASDQPRTARDIYVSSQYGHLHEASMSDFLDAIIIIRNSVVALTDLLHALDSISTDEIDVNVEDSVLPLGASTLAEQQTQTTALAKIDDLQDALESIALDRLLVRGMDQLHSFANVLANKNSPVISGANGYGDSNPCTAGQIWHVTNILAINMTSPTTAILLELNHDGSLYRFHAHSAATPATSAWVWSGHIWLDPSDFIRIWFIGGLIADSLRIRLTGEIMTLET